MELVDLHNSSAMHAKMSAFEFCFHRPTMMNYDFRRKKFSHLLRIISNYDRMSIRRMIPFWSSSALDSRASKARPIVRWISYTSSDRRNTPPFPLLNSSRTKRVFGISPATLCLLLLIVMSSTPIVNAKVAITQSGSIPRSPSSAPPPVRQPSIARQAQEDTENPTGEATDNTEFPTESPMSPADDSPSPTFVPVVSAPPKQEPIPGTEVPDSTSTPSTSIPSDPPAELSPTTTSPTFYPSAGPTTTGGIPSSNPTGEGTTESPSVNGTTSSPTNTGSTESPTLRPSSRPSTSSPTITSVPTTLPSTSPTATVSPTMTPSFLPSDLPSFLPSMIPTAEPTLATPSVGFSMFLQRFHVGVARQFTDDEERLIENLYRTYTSQWVPTNDIVSGRVVTSSTITNQGDVTETSSASRSLLRGGSGGVTIPGTNQTKIMQTRRALQAGPGFLDLTYEMEYTSVYQNVSLYPINFQNYVNGNLEEIATQMQTLRLNVTMLDATNRFVLVTPEPTTSPMPSAAPTPAPSLSPPPSEQPSVSPTMLPSSTPEPTESASNDEPTAEPPVVPTLSPEGDETQAPTEDGGGVNDNNTVIVVSCVVAGSILLIGALVLYRRRQKNRELDFRSSTIGSGSGRPTDGQSQHGTDYDDDKKSAPHVSSSTKEASTSLSALNTVNYAGAQGESLKPEAVMSPAESLVSNPSLLSDGIDMSGDSGDEFDATLGLADEFDQYKDKNMEKMRSDVEGNLTNFDGMMNQAMTIALFPDEEEEDDVDISELMWGGSGQLSGLEIEASALGEVMDWLKRNENSSVETKRTFMQEILNRMVTSVRHGILGPDDASRSIHECAALLGLQLATEIPVVTLLISGMSKKATEDDLNDAFREFGEVADVAVSSKERGFGILRFKNVKSVERAMNKFRTEEIVVQDVAVQVRILEPGGAGTTSEDGGVAANP